MIRLPVAYILVTAVSEGGDGYGCQPMGIYDGGGIGRRTSLAAGKSVKREKLLDFAPERGPFFLTMTRPWPIRSAVFWKAGIL